MTIVAYDGKLLVGDGLAVCNEVITDRNIKKIFIIGRGKDAVLIAGAGNATDILAFWHWQEAIVAGEEAEYPKFEDNFEGLVIEDKSIQHYSKGHPHGIDCDIPVAIGCGMPIALGAMDAGADAKRAVEIACNRDPHCGGKITVVDTTQYFDGVPNDKRRFDSANPGNPIGTDSCI